MTETLVSYSTIAVYSAMAIYALAFVMFALDLSRRVAAPVAAVGVQRAHADGSTIVLEKVDAPAGVTNAPRYLRAAMALTIMAWVLHVGAAVFRGVAAGRVPWANMFEFTLTATAIIVGVFLAVQFWQDLRFLGVFVSGFVLIALGVATVNFYVDVVPLPPALQSAWLVIHVFVASLGTGFFALGAALSIVQLLQARRAAGKAAGLRFLDTLPGADKLENMAYRMLVVGFVLWTFTLIAGAVWAERAWGRYWGWDTKEVWTFIIWTLFAGYIHARATRGWRGSRSAWLAIIGFSAVVFNFTIVNLFFKGLHAYSGL
ncbi:MAG: c-type cytochrome biogenesis protein CcsB [Salinibacterium sp.]|nr:c-type cytochrome biogenesis protein CcsB [Salinibacterium sp.]